MKTQKIKDVSHSYILFTSMLWFVSSFPVVKISFFTLSWYGVISISVWITAVMTFLTVIGFRLHAIIKYINEKE